MASGAEYPTQRPDGVLRLLDYGGRADAVRLKDAAITSGQAVLTSATASFTSADVGKYVVVQGAGGSGVQLASTILSVQSATQVTLAANASATVSGATGDYGSDNTAALNAMLTAATPPTLSTYGEAGGSAAYAPHGVYGFTGIVFVPGNVGFQGADQTLTVLRALGPYAQVRLCNPAGRTAASQMTQLNQGAPLSGVLSAATVTVTRTDDFTHPNAPRFTASGTLNSRGGGVASQTYTYTSKDATHFYGVSGGTAGVNVPDGVVLTQGDITGGRGGMIGRMTIDGNNIAGSATQPLVLFGKITQRTIVDLYTVNSWGDGEWWVLGQNSRCFNHNVENNRGNGIVFDVGTGGLTWYGTEVSNNGRNAGYNMVFRESMKSPINYAQPTDIHFVGGVCERGSIDSANQNVAQVAQMYFGAYSRITFTSMNIVGSRPSTSLAAALVGGETTINILSLANFPITAGSGGTVVIDNDLITFTGSTSTTLTGCSGVVNPHAYFATINWVSNSSVIVGRDDNVNGTALGSGLRFHNCIFQGDVGNNGVQGSGYVGNVIFDFQSGGGRGAPGFSTTGRNHVVSAGSLYLLDDTATDVSEQPGSLRTAAALAALPGSNLVNWVVNAAGGTKTADQLVRPRGDRGPTTAGVPTDALLGNATNPIYDGVTVVDTTDTRLYYRSGGAYQRVANYSDIPTGTPTVVYASADSSPLTSQASLQADSALLFAIGASEVWHVEGWLLFNAANTTMDLKLGWTGPAGYTGFWGSIGGTANTNNGWGPATAATTPVMLVQSNSQAYGSAAGDFGYAISGVFMGDGVHAGTVTLNWCQNTSDPGALIRKKGSMLILTRAQ